MQLMMMGMVDYHFGLPGKKLEVDTLDFYDFLKWMRLYLLAEEKYILRILFFFYLYASRMDGPSPGSSPGGVNARGAGVAVAAPFLSFAWASW